MSDNPFEVMDGQKVVLEELMKTTEGQKTVFGKVIKFVEGFSFWRVKTKKEKELKEQAEKEAIRLRETIKNL